MKRFDLMHQINARGAFLCTQACLPHLRRSRNPHVLTFSPPLNVEARWFGPHVAYSLAKFGMSLCVLGHAEELREEGVAVNALWPRSIIATAAVRNLFGGDDAVHHARRPEIMADAAYEIVRKPSREFTGNFCVDEEVLRSAGVVDLEPYACVPGSEIWPDFFL
jgi:citronellol/citronellal dehydrogenase